MPKIKIQTSQHDQFIDITKEVSSLIPSGMESGVCHIFSLHTTAALTINENADPDVCKDILLMLENLVPWHNSKFRHFEGNSAAHIKSSLMGFSETVLVETGSLHLGTWQGIYFCEFDGPKNRTVTVRFVDTTPCTDSR